MANDSGQPDSQNPIGAILTGDPRMTTADAEKYAAAQSSQKSAQQTAALVTDAGQDPSYIPAGVMEAFQSMKHQEILDGLTDMQPGVMQTFAAAWNKTGDAVMFNNMGLNAKVAATISSGWEGATADAIQAATRRFTDQMTDMHNVTQSVVSRIESAGYAAEVVRATVPPVPAAPAAPAVAGAPDPAAVLGFVNSSSEAEQAAQRAMLTYYVPSYQPAGDDVPTYVPPAGPNGENNPTSPASAGPNAPGVGGGTPGTPTASTPSGNPNNPSQPQSTGPSSTQTTPSSDAPGQQGNSPQTPDATAPSSVDPAATTPAGFTPGAATPGTATPGSTTPGWPGGIPGGAGVPDDGGSAQPGGPGRSVAGTPMTGGPAGGPAVAGRPAAAAGAPGMGAPGAGKGKGEEDKERKGRPELLVHERNKLDLIGEPQRATPPVFGKNPPPTDDRRAPDGGEGNRRR